MKKWFMVTIVGKDQPGLVAKVSLALFQAGGNLGEASMARLGTNFTIMLMAQIDGTANDLEKILTPVAESLDLHCHEDLIEGDQARSKFDVPSRRLRARRQRTLTRLPLARSAKWYSTINALSPSRSLGA